MTSCWFLCLLLVATIVSMAHCAVYHWPGPKNSGSNHDWTTQSQGDEEWWRRNPEPTQSEWKAPETTNWAWKRPDPTQWAWNAPETTQWAWRGPETTQWEWKGPDPAQWEWKAPEPTEWTWENSDVTEKNNWHVEQGTKWEWKPEVTTANEWSAAGVTDWQWRGVTDSPNEWQQESVTNWNDNHGNDEKSGDLWNNDFHRADHASATGSVYNYGDVIGKSILFYEAQRSGVLPADNRIPWRGDSALMDTGDNGEDLTGGWFDAGDFVKFGFPMAASTTILAWSLIEWEDSYTAGGQLGEMYDCIRWPLEYFIKAHASKNELYVQIGEATVNHKAWGRPEDVADEERSVYKVTSQNPGSDVAGETAAALAAGSIAFRSNDVGFADEMLQHAIDLYEFATEFQGVYSNSVPEASSYYRSTFFEDELAWASVWLYKATGEKHYLQSALDYLPQAIAHYEGDLMWALSWDDKIIGVQVMLHKIMNDGNYQQDVEDYMASWMPGGGVHYTPKGLAYRFEWGPLRYTANTALIALMAADAGLGQSKYRTWAKNQIHYMLGDSGRSYVCGSGINPPTHPHHMASSCPLPPEPCDWSNFYTDDPNPHTLIGALVGGPDSMDQYNDDRTDFRHTEVACDYNAGFQAALAGLKHLEITGKLP